MFQCSLGGHGIVDGQCEVGLSGADPCGVASCKYMTICEILVSVEQDAGSRYSILHAIRKSLQCRR